MSSEYRNSSADILASWTARGLPGPVKYPEVSTAEYHQALDTVHKVFAIRSTDRVLMLTDPLIDPRIEDMLRGISQARGATFSSFKAPKLQVGYVPEEVKPIMEQATFVIFTWFASVNDPYCFHLRKRGQRHVKITYFRNLDDLKTPQARFPVDLLGEIVRANARLYPEKAPFDLRFSDSRGTDLTIPFDQQMRDFMQRDNRWRGHNIADEDGCYVHYLPTHGPNLYDMMFLKDGVDSTEGNLNGVLYPQWAVGFERPFEEKVSVTFKNDHVVAVDGEGPDAEILHEMLMGGRMIELGCGHHPKARRFDVYPAGPNSPGALHFGIALAGQSNYIRRMMPNWEEPPIHMDLACFDTTVTAGARTLIDRGFLMALRDPAVVALAAKYGDPIDLLENFVQ